MADNHPLLHPKALAAVGVGGALGIGGAGLLAVGGLLVWIGAILTAIGCAAVIWIYWAELRDWRQGWGYSPRLTLAFVVVGVILLAGFGAFEKDWILKPKPASPPVTLVAPKPPQQSPAAPTPPTSSAPTPTTEPSPIRAPQSALGPEPTMASRIVMTSFDFGKVNDPTSKADRFVNANLENRGNIAGTEPIKTYWINIPNGYMSPTEIETAYKKLLVLAESHPPTKDNSRNQIDVGQKPFFTLQSGVTSDDWSSILSGKKRFYLFLILTYTDDTTKSGQYWVSEYCASQSGGEAIYEFCPTHNRTWLHH